MVNGKKGEIKKGVFESMEENRFMIHFEYEDEKLRDICKEAIRSKYGNSVSGLIKKRLDKELDIISKNRDANNFLVLKDFSDKSRDLGYPVSCRGTGGSSFVAYLCGLTEVNPLPAHYYCRNCRRIESYKSDDFQITGSSLPDKHCPICGKHMERDGFNIPFESFLGLNGEKKIDLWLDVAPELWNEMFEQAEELYGVGQVVCAGCIGYD